MDDFLVRFEENTTYFCLVKKTLKNFSSPNKSMQRKNQAAPFVGRLRTLQLVQLL